MELRPGYKQTELGSIPEDWDVPILRKHLQQDATYGVVTAGKFHHFGVPMVRGGDINNGRISEGQPLISETKSLEYGRTVLREGDVVIALVGYPGESAVVPSHLVGANISRAVGLLRPAGDLLSPYLTCYLNSPIGRKEFLRPSAGSAQIVVNLGALNKLAIPVPSKEEQSAIATALSDVDALLAEQEALIAKKRAIKQGAMQELLTGKRRLPGFRGEWEAKRLDQLSEIRSGGTPSTSRPEFWDGDVLWVTPTDITALDGHKFLASTARKITEPGLKASSAEIIPENSIVMTSRATIGECAINSVPLSTNQGFKNFVPNRSVDVEFLYYLLTTQKQSFISLCAGSTFLEIGKTQLVGFEVEIPNKEEQRAIAAALSDMDAEINALETQRAKTAQLKQGMMQELLTGRIRLV